MRWRRRLRDRLAVATRELLRHVLDHLPVRRHALQRLRHLLAHLAQITTTAAPACLGCRLHASLARQVCRQWPTGGLSALLRSCRGTLLAALGLYFDLRPHLVSRRILCRQLNQLTELQFELVDEPCALRRWTKTMVLQLGNRKFEVLDLGIEKFGPRVRFEHTL